MVNIKGYCNLYDIVIKRLNSKKIELEERQKQFEVFFYNKKYSKCFERNAINDLLVIQQLKSEISELEHLELIMRASGLSDKR